MTPNQVKSTAQHFPFAIFLITALLLAGCSRGPKVTIPWQDTASKQYGYALQFREDSNLDLIGDQKRFLRTRAIVREHYVKVAEFFPGDQKYTPLAKLEVIEMDAGLDSSRVKTGAKDRRRGLRNLQELATQYPDYEYIQAKTLFDQGLIHQALHEFPQAQAFFQQLRDKHVSSKNGDIRELARMGGFLYNKTYTNE